jgi:hypothetical protein
VTGTAKTYLTVRSPIRPGGEAPPRSTEALVAAVAARKIKNARSAKAVVPLIYSLPHAERVGVID